MTTRSFFSTLILLFMGAGLFATNGPIEVTPVTKIILVTPGELNDAKNPQLGLTDKGASYAQQLSEIFKTTHVDAIYSSGHLHTSHTIAPIAENKGISVQEFSQESLSSSLFSLYSENQGKTVLICADETTLPKVLNMLSGTRDYSKRSLEDGRKVFFVESERLGQGNVKTIPLRNQI